MSARQEANATAAETGGYNIPTPLKENGPASVGALPDHGSINPAKEMDMNDESNNTTSAGAPDRRPTDKAVADAMCELIAKVSNLRLATMVLDEYANLEFSSARFVQTYREQAATTAFALTAQQKLGIEYMLSHVRDLAFDLERAYDAAIMGEVLQ